MFFQMSKLNNFIVFFYGVLFFFFCAFFFWFDAYSYFGGGILIVCVFFIVFSFFRMSHKLDYASFFLFGYAFFCIVSEIFSLSLIRDYELHVKVLIFSFIPFIVFESRRNLLFYIYFSSFLMVFSSLALVFHKYSFDIHGRVDIKGANAFADIVMLFGVVSLSGVFLFKRIGRRLYSYSFLFFSVFSFLCAVFLAVESLSRGAWISIFFVLFAFVFMCFFGERNKLFFALFALVLTFYFSYSFSAKVNSRISSAVDNIEVLVQDENVETSVGLRVEMWKFGLHYVKDNLIFGLGSNGERIVKEKDSLFNSKIKNFKHLHNEYVNILVKNGLFALVFFLGWIFYLFIFFANFFIKHRDPVAAAGFFSVLHFSIVSMSNVKLDYNIGVYSFIIVIMTIYGLAKHRINKFNE